MRRVLWDKYSPLWDIEERKRPLKEIFEDMLSSQAPFSPLFGQMTEQGFLRKVVGSYLGGDPGPFEIYMDHESYGRKRNFAGGNLYSLLLLHGIVLPHEKLEGMHEYRTRDGHLYTCREGRCEVKRVKDE